MGRAAGQQNGTVLDQQAIDDVAPGLSGIALPHPVTIRPPGLGVGTPVVPG